jgi:hypothetical protein
VPLDARGARWRDHAAGTGTGGAAQCVRMNSSCTG